jgi:hypothetical protein
MMSGLGEDASEAIRQGRGDGDAHEEILRKRKGRRDASMGLQPHRCSIQGGNGATQWTHSPKVFSARHEV